MGKKKGRNSTNLDNIPDSLEKLLTKARLFGNKPKDLDNEFKSKLEVFTRAAKAGDRFDLIDRIEDARGKHRDIKKVWDLLMRLRQYDTVPYEELHVLDPNLEREDYDIMTANYFNSIRGCITVESAIDYIINRRQFEHIHIVASNFAERLNKHPREVEKYLKDAKKSSILRPYFVNWGDKKNGKNALFFVNSSKQATYQLYEFILRKFEKQRERKVVVENGVPQGYIHIDDACELGLTYTELVTAGRSDEIENVKKKKGRTTTFFFREEAIKELIERKRVEPNKNRNKNFKKRKTTSFAPKIEPPEESLFYCGTSFAPRETDKGPVPPEKMLNNAHYLTRMQLKVYYSLSEEHVDTIIGSGKLKETTIVGIKRYMVANWLMTNIKRELKIE
jgi:hypothetical protein